MGVQHSIEKTVPQRLLAKQTVRKASSATNNTEREENDEGLDMINEVPDHVLSLIISSLSVDEAVRTSVISKQWKPLWRRVSSLDFDGRRMIKALSQLHDPSSTFDLNKASEHGGGTYDNVVHKVMCQHIGNLVSCRFRHFRRSLSDRDLKKWVEFVILEKGLRSLILECDSSNERVTHRLLDMSPNMKLKLKPRIFSNLCSLELTNYVLHKTTAACAFEGCEKLMILKLKKMFVKDETINAILENCLRLEKFSLIESYGFNELRVKNSSMKYLELQRLMVIDLDVSVENLQVLVLNSLICPGLRIFTPNIESFIYTEIMEANHPSSRVLKTKQVLENCGNVLGSQKINIFRNLSVLSIDFNINDIRESLSLSFILGSCLHLENLEITIPVDSFPDFNDDISLPFPNSRFWERGVLYNCINHKLKYATIRGFTGREQEVTFVKHLIRNANMIKKITIIGDSLIGDEEQGILSLPRASPYLSVELKLKTNHQLVDNAKVEDVRPKYMLLTDVLHLI